MLQKERKKRRMTQKQLGDGIGVRENQISNYEHNRSKPSLDIYKNIIMFLDLSSDEAYKLLFSFKNQKGV